MDVERGAAWRRRQRRLRSWWRHEQQTVAAVLATVTHHSHSNVGGHRERRPAGTEDWHQHRGGTCRVLRALVGRWQAHGRVAAGFHVGALERHDGIAFELVQALDAPVLQMKEPLPNVLHFFVTSVAEQAAAIDRLSASTADGRTVGGSAYDRILFFGARDCGVERRHSSSAWSWVLHSCML